MLDDTSTLLITKRLGEIESHISMGFKHLLEADKLKNEIKQIILQQNNKIDCNEEFCYLINKEDDTVRILNGDFYNRVFSMKELKELFDSLPKITTRSTPQFSKMKNHSGAILRFYHNHPDFKAVLTSTGSKLVLEKED